ncbi:hypothetical protein BDV26DRAFT_262496 [Aspergillus bertholletiae]|uniref:Uncharacterized protein n=1 Tax=Aspergillus bertholletiae TaxID=1226010 RepID=A0A5N7B8A3_9EURO|nr:hypothetical protein BDV26DRAFT_262496 [Aspergillus bertholletiae]
MDAGCTSEPEISASQSEKHSLWRIACMAIFLLMIRRPPASLSVVLILNLLSTTTGCCWRIMRLLDYSHI